MSNEYPPRPTEMCEPMINGEMVASDVYDFYINNKLHKAIDDYWQSKYPTFAKGRIKRMRKIIPQGCTNLNKRLGKRTHQVCIMYFYHPITRWTRH